MNNISELHLLIDWKCHFNGLDSFLDKNKHFEHLKVIEKIKMKKLRDKKKVMSKFYNVSVDDYRGSTDFNLYIIKDTNPIYDNRLKKNKNNRIVNIHMYDLKMEIRKITGEIHATDNIQETKDNLKALGVYDKYYNEKKFISLQDVFNELNKYDKLKWVVLRNFEDMPDKINIDEHLDVDMLVNDYFLVKTILDGDSIAPHEIQYENGKFRIINWVNIDNKKVAFDFRFVGDNYYDKPLQQDILKTRNKHQNGFYVPNKENHLYSLIYHAVIHKPKISSTYIKVFKNYGLQSSEINKKNLRKKLNIWMEKNGYRYCRPEPSVGYFL